MTVIERVSLINSNQTQLNSDYDFSAFQLWLCNETKGVLFADVDTKAEFNLTETSTGVDISAGKALILCTRPGSSPITNKKFYALFELSATKEDLDNTSGNKIYIEIEENLVNDPTLIIDNPPDTSYAQGRNIGEVKSTANYPTHTNYIKLRENIAGTWTDVREYSKIDGSNIDLTNVKGDISTEGDINADTINSTSSYADEFYTGNGGLQQQINALASSITPTISLVTGEDIPAEKLVAVEPDGKVYKTRKSYLTPAQLGTITGLDIQNIETRYLTDDKAIVAYKKASDNKVYGVIVTFVRDTITVGTETLLLTQQLGDTDKFYIAVLSSTLFVVHNQPASNYGFTAASSVSGLVITKGPDAQTAQAGQSNYGDVCKVSETSFMIVQEDSADDWQGYIGTISGTTITFGVRTGLITTISANGFPKLCYISDGFTVAILPASTAYIQFYTISGTTIIKSTEIASGVTGSPSSFINCNGRLITLFSSSPNILIKELSYDGTTAVIGIDAKIPMGYTTTAGGRISASYIGNNRIIIANRVNTSNARFRVFELLDNALRPEVDFTIATENNGVGLSTTQLLTNLSKFLLVYNNTSTTNLMFSLVNNTENQYIGVTKTSALLGESSQIYKSGEAPITGALPGLPYYVGNDGALATSGNKLAGVGYVAGGILIK